MFKLLRKKKIDYLIQSYDRKHSFYDFDNLGNILILFHYRDIKDVVLIYNDLKSEGKNVQLWAYADQKSMAIPIPAGMEIKQITSKNISRLSSISTEILTDFEALQYDTIIDLSSSYEYVLYYLLAYNKAKFCIGIRHEDHKLYDFVLVKEDQMSLNETYQQLKKYLNNIRISTNNL